MAVFASLEEAQAYFTRERFATRNGMTLDALSEEEAVCSMEIGEGHLNALGGVMGGAIFTLADFASAALANHLHNPTVAQQVDTHFLNGVKGTRLVAVAHCRKNGRSSIITTVDVSDDTGRDIAQMTLTSFKLRKA